MPGAEELIGLLDSKIRCVLVTELPVDLGKLDERNTIFILQLPDGFRTAMGGRAGGSGERHLVKVYQFLCGEGGCKKVDEFEDEEMLEKLDLPYHAAALAVLLPDGNERLVAGVVDRELAALYAEVLHKLKEPPKN